MAVLPTLPFFEKNLKSYVLHVSKKMYKNWNLFTVWKFDNFSISQILREINLGDSRGAKSAISTHSETLNFDF